MKHPVEVRDPLHGSILVERDELAIVDHRFFQRLRGIRQLGFSDLSFPGATHSRYLHSIGVMHIAGAVFDSVFGRVGEDVFEAAPKRREELRRTVRVAALLHDCGHAPLSHATEFAMGPVGELGRMLRNEDDPQRRATHEDYTLRVILDSSLTPVLEEEVGLSPLAVAALIDDSLELAEPFFEHEGVDWRPLLSQIISSELDSDRMDYLCRDSFFTGASYGGFDLSWVLGNLAWHQVEGRGYLALKERALYAVEDFLLSRHHMFLMVYYHQRSVIYEEMLQRYFAAGGDGYCLPYNVEDYVDFDDAHLLTHLRKSGDPWARRIVEGRPYRLLAERLGPGSHPEIKELERCILQAGLPCIRTDSGKAISNYTGGDSLPSSPIYVLGSGRRGRSGPARPLHDVADLFRRYAEKRNIRRIYVPESAMDAAAAIADELTELQF